MLQMVKDEPEYAHDYYDYMVEEGRLKDTRDFISLQSIAKEQAVNIVKVSDKELNKHQSRPSLYLDLPFK